MQYLAQRKRLQAPELARYVGDVVSLPGFARYRLGNAKISTNWFDCDFSGSTKLGDIAPSIETLLEPAKSNPKCHLSSVRIELRFPLRLASSQHEDGEDYHTLHISGDVSESVLSGLVISQFGLKESWYQEHRRELPRGAFKKDTEAMKRWYQRLDRELRKVFPNMPSGIIE